MAQEIDLEQMMQDAFNEMKKGLGKILEKSPSDKEFLDYTANWIDVFDTVANNKDLTPERKGSAVSEILVAITTVVMGCLARECPHHDQHVFLGRMYEMIQDVGIQQQKKLMNEMLSGLGLSNPTDSDSFSPPSTDPMIDFSEKDLEDLKNLFKGDI